MKKRLIALALGMTMSAAAVNSVWAQEAPVQPEEDHASVLEDVEVRGRLRAEEVRRRVDAFIESNMAPPAGRPLARWNQPVCLATAQMSPAYAQAFIDRIAEHILAVGGDVGGPGCKPHVMVVGTRDGAAMARSLVLDDPRGYRPARGLTDRGSGALEAYQNSDAPVRWWHVSLPVHVDTGQVAVRLDGEDYSVLPVRMASLLRTNIRDDLARVTIIIDFDKLPGGLRLGALADYVAFVTLAQVNPDGDALGQDTILNLFRDPEGTAGLTQWDREYLLGLYGVDQNLKSSRAHARAIAGEVVRNRRDR